MSKFKILSIDGGGTRGITAAAFIAEFEYLTELPAREYFDLIAGASTGGIIAMCLGLGIPAAKIRDFYRDNSADIFISSSNSCWHFIKRGFTAKHKQERLRKNFRLFLEQNSVNPDSKLSDIDNWKGIEIVDAEEYEKRIRVMVAVFDLSPEDFRDPNNPGIEETVNYRPKMYFSNYCSDQEELIENIVCRTSAGPTYFPIADERYVDGGVAVNHPAISAVAFSVNTIPDKNPAAPSRTNADRVVLANSKGISFQKIKGMGQMLDNLKVLSVGTGTSFLRRVDKSTVGKGNWGYLNWLLKVPEMLTESNMAASEYYAFNIIPSGNYLRIQHDLSKIGDYISSKPKEISLDESRPDVIQAMMRKGRENFHANIKHILSFLEDKGFNDKNYKMVE